MLSNCKISCKVWCGAIFLLPFLPFYITLFLFSILYMQNEFKQSSGQLLNPGGSKCSPSREKPERNTWGFIYPRILGGKIRLEDTVTTAVAIYNLYGLNPYIDILYQEC